MTEILGFLIAFGLLAAFISALTSGALRNVAFGLLIVFAIIIGQERLGAQLSAFSFPFTSANTRGGAAIQTAPQSTGMGGPVYSTFPPSYGDNYPSRNTARTSSSGTDASRGYNPNAPYNGGYSNDPYSNDPYYSGSYPGGYYPPDSSYSRQTLTGRGVRALW